MWMQLRIKSRQSFSFVNISIFQGTERSCDLVIDITNLKIYRILVKYFGDKE